jgi:hypothetical protein
MQPIASQGRGLPSSRNLGRQGGFIRPFIRADKVAPRLLAPTGPDGGVYLVCVTLRHIPTDTGLEPDSAARLEQRDLRSGPTP